MSSTYDSVHLQDNLTEIHYLSEPLEENLSNSPTIITVQKGWRVILIHFPSSRSVSIGRSHNNDIKLSDPHFSRKAAEIILGPLPVLRKIFIGEDKNHEILPILPGKPVTIERELKLRQFSGE